MIVKESMEGIERDSFPYLLHLVIVFEIKHGRPAPCASIKVTGRPSCKEGKTNRSNA